VLDTRKTKGTKSEVYFAIGVVEDLFMCIPCKGGDRFPPFPRPPMFDLKIQVPFLNMENKQGELEEMYPLTHVPLINNTLGSSDDTWLWSSPAL
jgi:chromosome transmission fidelity protein 4